MALFSDGLLKKYVKRHDITTNAHAVPSTYSKITGTHKRSIHQPLRPVSCSRRTQAARIGKKTIQLTAKRTKRRLFLTSFSYRRLQYKALYVSRNNATAYARANHQNSDLLARPLNQKDFFRQVSTDSVNDILLCSGASGCEEPVQGISPYLLAFFSDGLP
ncbi:MAG: hypothetical protein Q3990_01415 [Desulfovibrionaceae bacterium]|nr:hypothetical protein [Desulfovibrionaceae bacterium]